MTRHAWIASAIALCASPWGVVPALAQEVHDHSAHSPPLAAAPAQPPGQTPEKPSDAPPMDHSRMDHSNMDHSKMQHGDTDHSKMDHGQPHAMTHAMTGALGPYPMSREATGTSWQPDAASHDGVHGEAGGWMLMGHALLNSVYDWQDGPRGDEKGFLAGMVMGSARRDFANGDVLQFRGMLSPDPFMGKRGYPLLLAAGETADGVDHLVDRQHPHDLIMELSASYMKRLREQDSVFVYAGLPGEPAFGPPAFMHRPAAIDSPEAPISHHWLDSTHITFGVVTAGWTHANWRIEASRFRGREPDENRYDIETGDLESTSVRLSWNPTQNLSLQASWADITSPEQLEPDQDETRWSASALYTRRFESVGEIDLTAAYGRKTPTGGEARDAWLGEAAWRPNADWTIFSRAETIETDELELAAHGHVESFRKISLGAVRDWRIADHVLFGVGALVSQTFVPDGLEASYGGDPQGAMGFVRLKIG